MQKKYGLIPMIAGLIMVLTAVTVVAQSAPPAAKPPAESQSAESQSAESQSAESQSAESQLAPTTSAVSFEPMANFTATVETGGPRLRVRAEPSLSAPIVARLLDGSVVNVVGRNAAGGWVVIPLTEADALYGWVSTSYLRLSSPISSLQVLTEAPTTPFVAPVIVAPVITTTDVLVSIERTTPARATATTAATVPAPAAATAMISPTVTPTMSPTSSLAVTLAVPPTLPPPPAVTEFAPAAPTSSPSQPSGIYGKIAVPVFDENRKTYNVWLVNADGSDLRLVVEQASSPTLSRDGAMLAYRRWKVDDRGIVVANADGSNPLRVTEKLEDVLPSFSPDRTKVAFSTYRWGDRKNRLYYAWSDEQNKVAWEWGNGGIFGEDPYWANDGRIYFRVTRPDRSVEELWSMDGRTGEDRTLIFITSSIRAPALSPDLRTVAYMAFVEGSWELYMLDLLDRTTKRLTDNQVEDGLPAFSPDGEYVAFVSDRGGSWGVWRMKPDGSDVRLISALPGSVDGRVEFEPDYLNHGWLEEQISWSW